MSRHSFSEKTLELSDLCLWLDNPRLLTHQADEMSCIQHLITDRKFIALLEDVAINGIGISPIVISENDDDGYIVRDGNRRIASLKLLGDPDLCPPELKGIQKKINSLAKKYARNIPDEINCMFSDNEDAIQQHLLTTHQGEQGGIGQVDWNALMQAAFDYKYEISGKYTKEYRLLLLAQSYGFKFSDDFPITTLGRFPLADFCKRCKIKVPKDISIPLTIKDEHQPSINTLIGFFTDIGDKKITVSTSDDANSVRGSAERNKYLETLFSKHKNNTKKPSAKQSKDKGSDKPTAKPKPTHSTDRTKFIPAKRYTKVPTKYVKENNIFADMTKFKSDDIPTTCIVMLRVFLEATLKTTAASLGVNWNRKGLAKMTEIIANKLHKDGVIDKPLRDSTIKLSGRDTALPGAFFTINTIQEFVHSKHSHPNKKDVNSFWDKLDPFIAKCWDTVEKSGKGKA